MKIFLKFGAMLSLALVTGFSYAQQATVVGRGQYNESDYGRFYIRLGVNLPQGHFKNKFDPTIPIYENIGTRGGIQAGTGANLELGRYFFLHAEPINDLFKVGLDATFLSVGYNQFDWGAMDNTVDMDKFDVLTAGVKLGPVVSFNVIDDFYADVFAKIAPTMLASTSGFPEFYEEDVAGNYEEFYFHDAESPIVFGWQSDFGVNLRYRKVTLTLSHVSGSFNITPYYYRYNATTDEEFDGSFEQKMPVANFQVKLGIQF